VIGSRSLGAAGRETPMRSRLQGRIHTCLASFLVHDGRSIPDADGTELPDIYTAGSRKLVRRYVFWRAVAVVNSVRLA
jgi:hypothetical protein